MKLIHVGLEFCNVFVLSALLCKKEIRKNLKSSHLRFPVCILMKKSGKPTPRISKTFYHPFRGNETKIHYFLVDISVDKSKIEFYKMLLM